MNSNIELIILGLTGLLSLLIILAETSLVPLSRDRRKLLSFFDFFQWVTASVYFLTLSILELTHAPTTFEAFLTFCAGTFFYIFFFQFFPRQFALRHLDKCARILGPIISILFKWFGWIGSSFDQSSRWLAELFGKEPSPVKPGFTGEEIKMLVNLGKEEPLEIEKEEKEMIESVMTFGQTMVKEIMTPRIDMICVQADTSVSGVLDIAIAHGYSKFPIYEETIDNIIGIIYLKDLFRLLRNQDQKTTLKEVMRKPFFVPESKKVDDLLREMQKEKISMAIIVDEYGGTDGLVTIEDIVEEIVGEITDEHETQLPDILPLAKDAWLIDGQINLEDLNAALSLNLPTEEFETLSGYLYGLMGKVPKVGDKIETEPVILEVMVVHRQRISKVKLTKKVPSEPEKVHPE